MMEDEIGIINHGRLLFEGCLDELRQSALQTGFVADNLEDMFLSMVGIRLPWGGSVSAAVFYVLYVLGTLAVSVLAKNTVSVAYAAFYQEKRRQFQEKMQEMNPFSPR